MALPELTTESWGGGRERGASRNQDGHLGRFWVAEVHMVLAHVAVLTDIDVCLR